MGQVFFPDKKELQEAYTQRIPVYEAVLEDLLRSLNRELKERELRFSLKFRVKSFSSYYQKVLEKIGTSKQQDTLPYIWDILGIRIVCPFLEDVKRAEETLRSIYRLFEAVRKGSDQSFREFGYQSLHLILELPEELRKKFPYLDLDGFEVQIRTILQDAWSEVEHELVYKANFTPYDESMRRKLAALNANLSLSDVVFQEIRDYQRSLHTELEKRRRSFVEKVEIETTEDDPDLPGGPGEFEKNNDFSSANVDELLLKALTAHNRGDYQGAIELYNEILSRKTDMALKSVIMVHRGMAFFSATRYTEALEDFRAAEEMEPENNKVHYYLGIVYRVLDRFSEALGAFQRSLEIYPFHFESLFSLAQTFFEIGDFPASLEYCEKALKILPENERVMKFRTHVLDKTAL